MVAASHYPREKELMKTTVKKAILRFADLVPTFLYRILVPRKMISFFYHLVSDKVIPHVQYLYPHRPVELFEQDLIYIKDNFHVLSYEELSHALTSRTHLPPRAAFLSFDDGFSECFSMARPLLLKYKLHCTFFLATNLIDNRDMDSLHKVSLCIAKLSSLSPVECARMLSAFWQAFGVNLDGAASFARWIKMVDDDDHLPKTCDILGVDVDDYLRTRSPYLTREQIHTMAAEGFTIGAHSQRHKKLGRLSQEEIEQEIVNSCHEIHDLTGKEPVPFAFPYSAMGIEMDFLRSLLKRTPLVGFLFNTRGLSLDEPFIVNRIWVESPKFNPTGQTSLPLILRHAYQAHLGLPPIGQ